MLFRTIFEPLTLIEKPENFNILKLTTKTMKYCHDCLTPIKRDSKEEYCSFCKRDRALKESSTA